MSVINQAAIKQTDKLISPAATSRSPLVVRDSAISQETSSHPSQTQDRPTDGNEIVTFIVDEMIRNEQSQDVKDIREKIRLSKMAAAEKQASEALLRIYEALKMFKDKVNYNTAWDHKAQIRSRWGKVSLLFGLPIRFDVWSNIHYGFIGLRCGFSADVLKKAAGYMQWSKSKVPDDWLEKIVGQNVDFFEALDDSLDQSAIEIGIKLAKIDGKPTDSSLLNLMRANIGRLSE